MFKVNDENFEITHALLNAHFDTEKECLFIGIEIYSKKLNDNRNPAIISYALLKFMKYELKKWLDIAGRVIEWKDFLHTKKGIKEPYAKFCYDYQKTKSDKNIYKSENSIYNTNIKFMNIENKIFVNIMGSCNCKFNGKEIKPISLEIETEINFGSITIWPEIIDNEDIARKRLNPFIDLENFEFCERISGSDWRSIGYFDYKNK